MATANITLNGRVGREWRYLVFGGSVQAQYRSYEVASVKTVGFANYAAAKSAADAAVAVDPLNVEALIPREGIFYSVIIDTFTYGDWTDYP